LIGFIGLDHLFIKFILRIRLSLSPLYDILLQEGVLEDLFGLSLFILEGVKVFFGELFFLVDGFTACHQHWKG